MGNKNKSNRKSAPKKERELTRYELIAIERIKEFENTGRV